MVSREGSWASGLCELALRERYFFVGRDLDIFLQVTRKVNVEGPDLTTDVTGGIMNTNFDWTIRGQALICGNKGP